MKKLFEFLKARILAEVPAIKTVRMWNGQTDREKGVKDEKPWRSPAVFIEFISNGEVKNLSLGIKDVPLIIRFRFCIEKYKFERLQDLDFQDQFDFFIQTLRGNEVDTVQFSTMIEINNEQDADFDMLNEPYMDYTTIFRKQTAFTRKDNVIFNPGNLKPNVIVQVVKTL